MLARSGMPKALAISYADQGQLIRTCSLLGCSLRSMSSRSGVIRTSRSGTMAPATTKPSAIEARLRAFPCWLICGMTNLSAAAAPLQGRNVSKLGTPRERNRTRWSHRVFQDGPRGG